MALRMLGQVDYQSDNRGWQMFAANFATFFKNSWIESPDRLLRFVKSFIHFSEQLNEAWRRVL